MRFNHLYQINAKVMALNKKPSLWLILIAFASTYIIWGTTYIAILIGIETLPPFLMAAIRFLVAGVVLLIIVVFRGEKVWVPGIFKNMLLGIVILTGGQGLLAWAELYIPSGYAAILVSTLPLWFVLLDRKNWDSYFKNKLILTGLILGFFGILLLFKKYIGSSSGTGILQLLGLLAVLGACVCWAGGTLYYKNHVNQSSMFLNLGWQLIGGFLSSLLIGFLCGELTGFSFARVSMHSWLATMYLAVAGSLVAFIAFSWLMTVKPAAVVGTYAYVNPVIAVLLGWLMANERITILQIAGMCIILLSAFLVNSPGYMANDTKPAT
jgi:drug/metabolite transporter (DMT)-like permease